MARSRNRKRVFQCKRPASTAVRRIERTIGLIEKRDTAMFIECQSANPKTHDLCIRIARRCVGVIQPLLRQEEVHDALTEFYRAARDEIEAGSGAKQPKP